MNQSTFRKRLREPDQLPPPNVDEEFSLAESTERTLEVAPVKLTDVIVHGYKNYAEFGGRATRVEFWKWYLYVVALPIAIVFLLSLLSFLVPPLIGAAPLALLLITIGHIIPTLACGVRRLHDSGRPGYAIMTGLIPIFGNLVLLYWLLQPSTLGQHEGDGGDSRTTAAHGNPHTDFLDGDSESSVTTAKEGGRLSTKETMAAASLGFVALLVVVVLISTSQVSKLVSSIERSEDVQRSYVAQQVELWSELEVRYGKGLVAPEARAEFLKRGGDLASSSSRTYFYRQEEIRQLSLPFWDKRARKLRELYLMHSEAWLGRMKEQVGNAFAFGYKVEIDTTWRDFCGQIGGAKPISAIWGIGRRIEALCKPD